MEIEKYSFLKFHNEFCSGEMRVLYMVTDPDDNCDLAFMQIDLPKQHGPGMLLGEVFMRHYFTVFSRETHGDHEGFGVV